ncbi:MAG: short-chain fatty acid transporter [Elusimicrobia bacterium]|nr:short-chain fatty acid transporter [Elusimicrobiota bacterium]
MSRVVPDAFILAVFLTFIVFALAKALTPSGWGDIVLAWGDGFWALLSFSMQMSLVMLTGFIVSHSPYVRRGLHAFSSLAKDGRSACALMAFSSMVLAWFHWGLGIVGSAVLTRYFALRQQKIHYPLLVASGYFGMGAIWHAGLSGSAPLLVATKGHFLESSLGVVPFGQTIFSPWNLILSFITIGVLTALAWRLYPAKGQAVAVCPEATLDQFHTELVDKDEEALQRRIEARSPAQWLESTYWVNGALGVCGLMYLALLIGRGRWNFDLNLFNFIFLTLAVLIHPNIKSLLEAAADGAKTITGIVLQFPIYAGMFGVIKSTGLANILAQWFASLAGPKTFPLVVYFYSGVLNYFVPSGGSKWAIEAPYLLEAAKSLGVPAPTLVLSYAWGDMVTDLIQPFWCLPLLAAAQIEFRQIMGYLTAAFVAATAVGTVGILILGVL